MMSHFVNNVILALTMATSSMSLEHHSVASRWTFNWTDGSYPRCVPCRGIPDGPLAGNGDLGVIIGGDSGPLGLPISASERAPPQGLGLYIGKNDFWGFPDATTYHATFQHFSPGFLLAGLVDFSSNLRLNLPHFAASQRLSDGLLSALASDPTSGFSIIITSAVLASRNVIVSNVTTACPPGVASVIVNLTLGSDNPFRLPLNVAKRVEERQLLANRHYQSPHAATMTMTKASVHGYGRFSPVLTPCTDQIVYNGIRTFSVEAGSGILTIINGTAKPTNGSSPPRLCFLLEEGWERVITGLCDLKPHSMWVLGEDGRIRIDPKLRLSGRLKLRSSHVEAAGAVCLSVADSPNRGLNVTCQPRSYYTDPSPGGACQSMQWQVLPTPCSKATVWRHNPTSGFLTSYVPGAEGRCLTSVGPVDSNNLAVSVLIVKEDGHTWREDPDLDPDLEPKEPGSSASVLIDSRCGSSLTVSIGVVTQRDVIGRYGIKEAADPQSMLKTASILASLESLPGAKSGIFNQQEEKDKFGDGSDIQLRPSLGSHLPVLLSEHQAWWRGFYDRSWVDLGGPDGEWSDLERFYWTMLYLMGSSMREGSVAPALWGPFSTTDTPQWSDDMTLDYNFQANFWSASTANRPELVLIYAATILDSRLVELAKARASSTSWSLGGWPDQFGAEVMGMSCGPTPDWDHDFGCPEGFGGFDGVAFVSCGGPFRGMECCFDDGTRFVSGLVATPLIQYYDMTQDEAFLKDRLVPYLEQVAAFYLSYATWNSSRGVYEFRYTCAQEICASGLDPPQAEHNSHQDLAYARMVLTRLLHFTDPDGVHGGIAKVGDRGRWALLLDNLVDFPLVGTADNGGPVFSEAETDDPLNPQPALSNANYPIAHLAAVFPAGLINADMATMEEESGLFDIAQRTAEFLNKATGFSPGNGFCLSWPPAAILATDGESGGKLLHSFSKAYKSREKPNGWPDLGGGGLEQMGAIEALHALMLRVDHRGVLSVFPAWPRGSTAVSFTRLRAKGAYVITASWNGTGVASPVEVISDAGHAIIVLSPWSTDGPPCVTTHSSSEEFLSVEIQSVHKGPIIGSWSWPTVRQRHYRISESCGKIA